VTGIPLPEPCPVCGAAYRLSPRGRILIDHDARLHEPLPKEAPELAQSAPAARPDDD
jgi:hypothetical protein